MESTKVVTTGHGKTGCETEKTSTECGYDAMSATDIDNVVDSNVVNSVGADAVSEPITFLMVHVNTCIRTENVIFAASGIMGRIDCPGEP